VLSLRSRPQARVRNLVLRWRGRVAPQKTKCRAHGGRSRNCEPRLTFGLLTSFEARDLYENNGSLGMKNDYLVLAEDLLCCSLRSVAMFMFVMALLPLPLGLLIGWWRNRTA
jgi:hypothetical protein